MIKTQFVFDNLYSETSPNGDLNTADVSLETGTFSTLFYRKTSKYRTLL